MKKIAIQKLIIDASPVIGKKYLVFKSNKEPQQYGEIEKIGYQNEYQKRINWVTIEFKDKSQTFCSPDNILVIEGDNCYLEK